MLVLSAGIGPLWGQPGAGCSTEVYLYVDKTESTNARDTARTVLELLSGVPNLRDVVLFSFAGEVPVSTFVAEEMPLDSLAISRLLDRAILQEPSSAFTLAPDYLALFEHIERTIQERSTVADLRVYIVLSDFSMRRREASHEQVLPTRVLDQMAALRRSLVARGNQRLLAVRTQPRQEPSPSLQNNLLGEVARNFTLVEDPARIAPVLGDVFLGETPLQLELDFNPQTSVYSLTLANPSCTLQQNIVYRTLAAGTDTRLSIPWCPTELRPGETGTCTFAPTQVVLPPLPTTCLSVWLRAESGGPAATTLIGTANEPILAGNCVFLSAAVLDSTQSFATEKEQDLASCGRAAIDHPGEFITCLKVRGRLEGDENFLRIRQGEAPADPWLIDQRLSAEQFNGAAFHGGERLVPVTFPLDRWDADWLCTPAVHETERKLEVQIVSPAGVLARGRLGRVLPPDAEDPLDLWRKLLLPLLVVLFLSGFVANYLKTASLGMLDGVLFVLGLGLSAILFAAYGGSGVGEWVSSLFGARSFLIASLLLGLLALAYWLLFARGFFDRQLTAPGKVSLTSRVPLAERRRQRFQRTLWVLSLGLVGTLLTIALLWFNPREVRDCRYELIDLPTNTAVLPVNLPPTTDEPAP